MLAPHNPTLLPRLHNNSQANQAASQNKMFSSRRSQSQPSRNRDGEPWLAASLRPTNFVPGLVIGFLLGLFVDLATPCRRSTKGKQQPPLSASGGEELKMVLVVRQDLKMGVGKIASQCAHAATGIYAELVQSHRLLLRQWEQCGQPKIVLSCKNQQEMNKLKEAADRCGLPNFIVADAGRTQVIAGSRTVLAIGPGALLFGGKQRLIRLLGNNAFYENDGSNKGDIEMEMRDAPKVPGGRRNIGSRQECLNLLHSSFHVYSPLLRASDSIEVS